MSPSNTRRDGRRSFFEGGDPEQECPYRKPHQNWDRENWIDGWNQAQADCDERNKEQEEKDSDYIRNCIKNADDIEELKTALLEMYDDKF